MNPYEILGAPENKDLEDARRDLQIRLAYRQKILAYTKDRLQPSTHRKIKANDFRLICRAYETLGDRDKRKDYDKTGQWVTEIPIENYDLRQLAAEPELIANFQGRVKDATLRQIDEKQGFLQQTPIYCAARACNTEAVEYLVEQDADPDITQRTGSTALHAAAFFGHAEMVKCLLSCGASYAAKNAYGNLPEAEGNEAEITSVFTSMKQIPFVRAAAGDFDWLKTKWNTDENHVDQQYFTLRQTVLHCAAKKGYTEIVHWLIEEKKVKLDLIDLNLNSALHLAAHKGHGEIVEYLLEQGADSTLINKWGFTAEQEGLLHREIIEPIFKHIKTYDMFKMAGEGKLWWFQYHFDVKRVNEFSETGAPLLYVACRNGHVEVARFLLDHGADINAKLTSQSGSTALHGAAYYNHVEVVQLLLNYNVDVSIRNAIGETVFENIKSDEVRQLLDQHRKALKESRVLTVCVYGDGKKSGDNPLATIKLPLNGTLDDLKNAIPASVKDLCRAFTIARRPLRAEKPDDKLLLLSLIYRARYGRTQFIDIPLCIIGHESPRYVNGGHEMRKDLPCLTSRAIDVKLRKTASTKRFSVVKTNKPQSFTFGDLVLTFASECVQSEVEFDIVFSESPEIGDDIDLPGCTFFFKIGTRANDAQLSEMPEAHLKTSTMLPLYMWVSGTGYWVSEKNRRKHLLLLNGYYAFVKHADAIGDKLQVPRDMIISPRKGEFLQDRTKPISCRCLQVREHDKVKFPHLAYHGTNIKLIQSIFMDSLVMPSTVVSSGLRVCPPDNHIARGVKAFGIEDFSNALFVSPSIHYCSDPAYAVTFDFDGKKWIGVLECSIKSGTFKTFASTVPGYKAHPDDDLNAIEWRLTNPADIEILSVLLIPQQLSRLEMAKLRAAKLEISGPLPGCR